MAREYVKGRSPEEAKKVYYERYKQYLKDHPEKLKEYRRNSYLRNREKNLETQRRWREAHREEINRKRRERFWRETWAKLGVEEPPEMPKERLLSREERAVIRGENQHENAGNGG